MTVSSALGVLSGVSRRTLNIVDQFRFHYALFISLHKRIFRVFFSPAAITTRLRFVDFRPFYYVDARVSQLEHDVPDVYVSYTNRVRRTNEKIVFECTPFFRPFFQVIKTPLTTIVGRVGYTVRRTVSRRPPHNRFLFLYTRGVTSVLYVVDFMF